MEFLENYPLAGLNTFGIKTSAAFYCEAATVDDLKSGIQFSKERSLPFFILGGGSNVLFTTPFKGLVIRIVSQGIKVISENEENAIIEAAAGEVWHDLVLKTIQMNLGGLENLSLIPGTVGASPIQNIGAYGVEVKDTLHQVDALEISTGKIVTFSNEECHFGYRDSIFKTTAKGKYIILSVRFLLTKKPKVNISYGQISEILKEKNISSPTIQDVSESVIFIRKSKLPDPKELGNAGSFFKNPTIEIDHFNRLKATYPDIPSYPAHDHKVKIPAGWLIEQQGWKGKSKGNAAVHEKQALVLINKTDASGKEIYTLAESIQKNILEVFEIALEIEVNII